MSLLETVFWKIANAEKSRRFLSSKDERSVVVEGSGPLKAEKLLDLGLDFMSYAPDPRVGALASYFENSNDDIDLSCYVDEAFEDVNEFDGVENSFFGVNNGFESSHNVTYISLCAKASSLGIQIDRSSDDLTLQFMDVIGQILDYTDKLDDGFFSGGMLTDKRDRLVGKANDYADLVEAQIQEDVTAIATVQNGIESMLIESAKNIGDELFNIDSNDFEGALGNFISSYGPAVEIHEARSSLDLDATNSNIVSRKCEDAVQTVYDGIKEAKDVLKDGVRFICSESDARLYSVALSRVEQGYAQLSSVFESVLRIRKSYLKEEVQSVRSAVNDIVRFRADIVYTMLADESVDQADLIQNFEDYKDTLGFYSRFLPAEQVRTHYGNIKAIEPSVKSVELRKQKREVEMDLDIISGAYNVADIRAALGEVDTGSVYQ